MILYYHIISYHIIYYIMYTCTHMSIFVYVCVYIYIYTPHVYIYIYIYICIYTHVYVILGQFLGSSPAGCHGFWTAPHRLGPPVGTG